MSTKPPPSRRSTLALAAALAATALTGAIAVGGIQNWHRQGQVPLGTITQPAPVVAAPPQEEENE